MASPELMALHRHWLRADAIKYVLFPDNKNDEVTEHWPQGLQELAEMSSAVARLEVLYGLLYVVIEGYKELGCKFDSVDTLLKNEEYVDHLRRFRNAVFHYQKQPVNAKLLAFLEARDSEDWIRELHNEFGQFFLDQLPVKEQLAKLTNNGA